MIKKLYLRYCSDYWENVWNMIIVEYYVYLGCWFNIAFN